MEITILGSGTYQPELKRHSSGYLVKIGRQNLVFDFGRGTLAQLLKVGIEYYHLEVIFITHLHADHCSELGSLLHIALAEPEKGRFRKKDLTIYGPKGLKKTVKHLLEAFDLARFRPPHKVVIKELKDGEEVKNKDWILKSYQVKHSPSLKCLAYRLESKNKILAYSGDTADCPGLRKAVSGADLAVIETNWPQELKPVGHLTGEVAGQVARASGVKKLVLTHVAPYYLKNFDPQKEAKKFYKGPVIVAKDLMRMKI